MARRATFGDAGREVIALEYYDMPTMLFHRTTALLVLLLFGTAYVWNTWLPHDHYWRPILQSTHVSLGILFAGLFVVRGAWRLTRGRHLPAEAGISGVLSRAMYLVLYFLLGLQVVLGFVLRWSQGDEFQFFGLFSVPALLGPNRTLAHSVDDLHYWVAWIIIVLAAGHSLVALFHHYVLKDAVLKRMLYPRVGGP